MNQEAQGNSHSAGYSSGAQEENQESNSNFECNICLDVAKDAVVSYCGHLFCWGCLHKWLETRPNRSVCPVCKAGISKDKVVPLYGRGNPNPEDPREKLPPRPQAQRPEPENTFNPFPGFNFGGNNGFQVSLGIGAFPFAFFSTTFGNANQPQATPGSQQAQEEQFLSKLFLWIAFLFLLWLFLA